MKIFRRNLEIRECFFDEPEVCLGLGYWLCVFLLWLLCGGFYFLKTMFSHGL